MSTLKVTNIQATGETASRAVSGVAAAWVDIPSGQASITDSINVSSLDDDGTGDGGINFTSSMATSSYTFTSGTGDSGAASTMYACDLTLNTNTAASYDFETIAVNSAVNRTNVDLKNHQVIHGDLA